MRFTTSAGFIRTAPATNVRMAIIWSVSQTAATAKRMTVIAVLMEETGWVFEALTHVRVRGLARVEAGA